MKSTFALLAFAGVLALPVAARAVDEYDDSQAHPLRVAAYAVHPVGVALEWIVFRPIHYLVAASPETEYVFGHRPHGVDEFAVEEIPTEIETTTTTTTTTY